MRRALITVASGAGGCGLGAVRALLLRSYTSAADPLAQHMHELRTRLTQHRAQNDRARVLSDCIRIRDLRVPAGSTAPVARLQTYAYESLLAVLAEQRAGDDAYAVAADMVSHGLFTPYAFECAVEASRGTYERLLSVVRAFGWHGLRTWTPKTYTALFQAHADAANLEMVLYLFFAAQEASVPLEATAVDAAIRAACTAHEPRLACDIARSAGTSARGWQRVLRAAAECDHAAALAEAWTHLAPDFTPDEGLFLQMIQVAARGGNDTLADSFLASFPRFFRGARRKEWHFVPLFDAYCHAERFADAIALLDRMQQHAVRTSTRTLARLTTAAAKDAGAWADAVEAALRAPSVPITAFHALLYAGAERADLPTAQRLWHGLVGNATVSPDLDAHHALLQCCIATADLDAGRAVWASVGAYGLRASPTTYERMARLHLTQPVYDEAFALLEESKARGFVPSRRMYAAMVWTCLQQDDPRVHALLQEMHEARYEPGAPLQEALTARGYTG